MTHQSSRRSPGRSLALIPARIAGRYEPLAKIASGGMATVYLARALTGAGFGKLVALKCVHPHLADDPDFVDMFLDEARIASHIDHPNVCNVFDAGEDAGTHYIAMEYLHGEPIASLLKAWDRHPESRPAEHSALSARIVADAAMGLHAAHELRDAEGALLGLVHRDISPHNLFLTYSGSVKVVDFGIAKAAGRRHETTTGVVKGKVAYMSPEQLHAKELDRRSDVWALGVTLWELLTGQRLFRRDDQIQTLNAVLESRIPSPSELAPSVPAALDAVVMRALRRPREHRQASARELADELETFLVSRERPVGMSQLADLMSSAFADAIEDKERWVRAARGGGSVEPLTTSAPPVEATVSEVRPTQQLALTEPVELPVRRTGRWAAGLAVVLALFAALARGLCFGATREARRSPPRRLPRRASPPARSPSGSTRRTPSPPWRWACRSRKSRRPSRRTPGRLDRRGDVAASRRPRPSPLRRRSRRPRRCRRRPSRRGRCASFTPGEGGPTSASTGARATTRRRPSPRCARARTSSSCAPSAEERGFGTAWT